MDAKHRFCKKHLRETQLPSTTENVKCCLSDGKQIDAVFLDYQKCRQSASLTLILTLEYCVIRNNRLQRIGSFLNMKQCVILDSASSNLVPVTSGDQRGTVLFLIFINDRPDSISSSVELFVDNCLVYRTIISPNDAIRL